MMERLKAKRFDNIDDCETFCDWMNKKYPDSFCSWHKGRGFDNFIAEWISE
jgi:hypothetical protein